VPTSFGETTAPGGQDARISSTRFRSADADDAEQIAALHADSWRRHYRGAYADSFLDGDVAADRRLVWSSRFAAPANTETVVAERDGRLIGFIHVVFDADPRWGSLIDNLHVVHDQRRTGIGTHLLSCAARAVSRQASGDAMYLWVLQQNTAAQQFYCSCGATRLETAPVPPPGGDPARLKGTPRGLRMVWPNVARLLQPRRIAIGDDVMPPSPPGVAGT
jgi:GNAT superfamily N-acetyltransferase